MSRLMLCGLMAGVIVFSSAPVRADDAEDTAVAFVEKLGGNILRDEKAPGKPVVWVLMAGTKMTDAGLKELAPLKNLTTLNLTSTQVSDAGLKALAPLKNLTTLVLTGTEVTDAGLKNLAPLKNLTLVQTDTKVTDRTLAVLREINLLHALPLATAADGKRRPAKPEDVTTLNLTGTEVTDAGLKELALLKNLTTLELGGPTVTDTGLKELAALKNLTTLKLVFTEVTDTGVKELQKALPKCKIDKIGFTSQSALKINVFSEPT
jgi:internalin A